MDGAFTFIHICVDSSRTVLEHHRSFHPIYISKEKKNPGQLPGIGVNKQNKLHNIIKKTSLAAKGGEVLLGMIMKL